MNGGSLVTSACTFVRVAKRAGLAAAFVGTEQAKIISTPQNAALI
jgi:hypothetical protein